MNQCQTGQPLTYFLVVIAVIMLIYLIYLTKEAVMLHKADKKVCGGSITSYTEYRTKITNHDSKPEVTTP